MLYHVSLSRNSLWCYGDRPYPELPREIAEWVLPSQNPLAGRVWWYGPFRAGLPGFAYTLPLSLPSAYGAYGFGGYDPIIEARPETRAFREKFDASPAEASRAYGIRWVLVANADYYKKEWEYWWAVRKSDWCFEFSDSGWPRYREKSLPAAKLRVRREEVSLYELPDASPMAFDRANPRAPLPIEFHGWGAAVEVPGTGPADRRGEHRGSAVAAGGVRTAAAGILGRRVGTHGGPRARRRNARPGFLRSALAAGDFLAAGWQRRRSSAWS